MHSRRRTCVLVLWELFPILLFLLTFALMYFFEHESETSPRSVVVSYVLKMKSLSHGLVKPQAKYRPSTVVSCGCYIRRKKLNETIKYPQFVTVIF